MNWRTVFFIFSFLFASLFLQADLVLAPSTLQVYKNADENWYGIVLKRLETMSCEQGIPVTFLFPERKGFHTCRFFKVLNSISPFRESEKKIIFLKSMARILTLAFFCALSYLLMEDFLSGLLLGLWHFLDPGIGSFKPIIELLSRVIASNPVEFTQSARLISPLHYFLPGFFLILGYVGFIKGDQIKKYDRINSGIFIFIFIFIMLGFFYLLSLTPFYTWLPISYILATLVLYSQYYCSRSTKLILSTLFGMGSLLFAWELQKKSGVLFEDQVLLRSGFFKHNFNAIFVAHKGLIIASGVVAAMAYDFFGKRVVPAILVGAGLYFTQNFNLFTGFELQNFHFKDYLGPFFLSAGFLYFLWRFPRNKLHFHAIAILVVLLGGIQYVQSQYSMANELAGIESEPDHDQVLQYIRDHFHGKKIFCNHFRLVIPLETDALCYEHHLLMTYPISDQELLEIFVTSFKLLGYSVSDVERDFENETKRLTIAVWNYGVMPDWVVNIPENVRYGTKQARDQFIQKWLRNYGEYPVEKIMQTVRSFDAVILRKDHWMIPSHFRAIREFSYYGIYVPK